MGDSIIVTIQRPRPIWNFVDIHKLPVANIHTGHPKIISYGRTHVQAGIMVTVWPGAFTPKDILPVVNLERSHIFPLCVAGSFTMPDRYPVALADRLAITGQMNL